MRAPKFFRRDCPIGEIKEYSDSNGLTLAQQQELQELLEKKKKQKQRFSDFAIVCNREVLQKDYEIRELMKLLGEGS